MRAICPCGRGERGFIFQTPRNKRRLGEPAQPEYYCSMKCMDGRENVIDPTTDELASIEAGGHKGGEFLDEIGKSDLATLTRQEWLMFCRCVITGYIAEMQHRIQPPF
jgi:hypothetical protein